MEEHPRVSYARAQVRSTKGFLPCLRVLAGLLSGIRCRRRLYSPAHKDEAINAQSSVQAIARRPCAPMANSHPRSSQLRESSWIFHALMFHLCSPVLSLHHRRVFCTRVYGFASSRNQAKDSPRTCRASHCMTTVRLRLSRMVGPRIKPLSHAMRNR